MKSCKSDTNVKYHRGGSVMSKFKVGYELEQEIDKLLQTYSKDEIVQAVNKLYK